MALSEQPLAVKNAVQFGLYSVVVHEHWPVRQRMIVEMGYYAWSEHIVTVFLAVRLPLRTYKSNLQSKEKQPQTVTPPPPKAVVPKMWLSWNEVFRWRHTLARPSVGRNKKRLSSDQWTRLHVRIVHPKWSCDQSNRAWRWRNVNCGRCMCRHARIPWWWRHLITVHVLMWPPNAKLPRSAPAIGMHNGGFSHRRVTDHFRVNHSIIVRLMQRFRQTGNVTDRPRVGRPRKTTPREDRLISRRAVLVWLIFAAPYQTNRKWNLKFYPKKSAFVCKHKCWKVHVALYTPCHIHVNKNQSITCFTGK
jgi:hypothetical protein